MQPFQHVADPARGVQDVGRDHHIERAGGGDLGRHQGFQVEHRETQAFVVRESPLRGTDEGAGDVGEQIMHVRTQHAEDRAGRAASASADLQDARRPAAIRQSPHLCSQQGVQMIRERVAAIDRFDQIAMAAGEQHLHGGAAPGQHVGEARDGSRQQVDERFRFWLSWTP